MNHIWLLRQLSFGDRGIFIHIYTYCICTHLPSWISFRWNALLMSNFDVVGERKMCHRVVSLFSLALAFFLATCQFLFTFPTQYSSQSISPLTISLSFRHILDSQKQASIILFIYFLCGNLRRIYSWKHRNWLSRREWERESETGNLFIWWLMCLLREANGNRLPLFIPL